MVEFTSFVFLFSQITILHFSMSENDRFIDFVHFSIVYIMLEKGNSSTDGWKRRFFIFFYFRGTERKSEHMRWGEG